MVSWTNETLQGANGFNKIAITIDEILFPAMICLFLAFIIIILIKKFTKPRKEGEEDE